MPTPPTSSVSPSKKRRLGSGSSSDPNRTPRAHQPVTKFQALRLGDGDDPFLLLRPDSTGSPSRTPTHSVVSESPTRTTSSHSARRSASPIKTTQSLGYLEKPVTYCALDDNATQLPDHVGPLYERIYNITQYGDEIYPAKIVCEITRALKGRRPRNNEWVGRGTDENEDGDTDDNTSKGAELEGVCKIAADSRECERLGRSEAAWNSLVHWPLLRLALSPARHRHVTAELSTTAAIQPKFAPKWGFNGSSTGAADVTASKMIDFVLLLDLVPKPHWSEETRVSKEDEAAASNLHRAIIARVKSLPADENVVNQTKYAPLADAPIAVSIETKTTAASIDEGKVQLGVWTAAWHKRMRLLGWNGSIITLPLLLTVGHDWKIFFACDRGDRIEILGEINIGDTSTIQGLYKLLAVIRALADWIVDTYKSWIVSVFLPPPAKTTTRDLVTAEEDVL